MPPTPKIEDRLQRELSLREPRTGDLLDVVVRFNLPSPAAAPRQPLMQQRSALASTMTRRIEEALMHASSATGETPAKVSVFPSLGSVMVQASRPFVRELLEQDEVRGAVLNADASLARGR